MEPTKFKTGPHSVTAIDVHLVWCTKYRRPFLKGQRRKHAEKIAIQVLADLDTDLLCMSICPEHVHVMVRLDPKLSVSKLICKLKSITSLELRRTFPELRSIADGKAIWARGFFAASVGSATRDQIMSYVKNNR